MNNELNNNIEVLLCQKCNIEIPLGSSYYSIVKNLEYRCIDDEGSEEEIRIINTEEITSLCKSCGNQFNMGVLDTILRHLPLSGQESRN